MACLNGLPSLFFAVMDCRQKMEDVCDLGETTKVLKGLSMVLECDESMVTHKVRSIRSIGFQVVVGSQLLKVISTT